MVMVDLIAIKSGLIMKLLRSILLAGILLLANTVFAQSQGVMMASGFSPEDNMTVYLYTGNCRNQSIANQYPYIYLIENGSTHQKIESCYNIRLASQEINLYSPNQPLTTKFTNYNLTPQRMQEAFAQPR